MSNRQLRHYAPPSDNRQLVRNSFGRVIGYVNALGQLVRYGRSLYQAGSSASRMYSRMTQGHRARRKRTFVEQNANVADAGNVTFVRKYKKNSGKSKKKKSKSVQRLERKIRKVSRAVANRPDWRKPWCERAFYAFPLIGAKNVITWKSVSNTTEINQQPRTLQEYINLLDIVAGSGADNAPAFVEQDGTTGGAANTGFISYPLSSYADAATTDQQFKFEFAYEFWLKNNTTGPCEITIYVVKCVDDTLTTPFDDLDGRYRVAYTDAVSNDYAKDPGQYFSTPGTRHLDKYKIHSKQVMKMEGGHEGKIYVNMPAFIFRPAAYAVRGLTTSHYIKGSYHFMVRLSGVPAHGETDTTKVGLSDVQLDAVVTGKRKISMRAGAETRKMTMDPITYPLADQVPVIGDPEQVGVGIVDK